MKVSCGRCVSVTTSKIQDETTNHHFVASFVFFISAAALKSKPQRRTENSHID